MPLGAVVAASRGPTDTSTPVNGVPSASLTWPRIVPHVGLAAGRHVSLSASLSLRALPSGAVFVIADSLIDWRPLLNFSHLLAPMGTRMRVVSEHSPSVAGSTRPPRIWRFARPGSSLAPFLFLTA